MSTTSPTVFISYSHDSEDHKERVRALSSRLRLGGISCRTDQDILNPPEGWPRWCENAIEESSFVLVVPTETYYSRYRGKETTGKGKGVKFEGFIITQQFYDNDSRNEKFFPVLFRQEDESYIPTPLRGASRYLVETEEGYEQLYRLLTDQHATPPVPLGQLQILPPRPMTASNVGIQPKPNTLPYRSIDSLFKGRADFLQELHNRLQAGQTVGVHAVHGLGGVGKSRLAVEYGWKFQDEYEAILFIGAELRSELFNNLAGLCGRLGLGLQDEPREMVKAEAALAWMESHSGWLVIFDNADTPETAEAVEEILPRLIRGHVVITSRLADWGPAVTTLELNVLASEDAVAFLLERTSNRRLKRANDTEVAERLAEAVGCLALALEQAGAFIKQRRCSLADYLTRWQDQDMKVRGWFDPRLCPQSVATTWETSFEQLDETSQALLNTLAWLAPEPMPAALLADMDEDAVAELVSYSLARWDIIEAGPETTSVPPLRLHRLVQEVARQRLPTEERRQWLEKALNMVDEARPGDPTDVFTWPAWNDLQPHVIFVIKHAILAGVIAPTTILMNELGVLQQSLYSFDNAETLYRQALTIEENCNGTNHPNVAGTLSNLVGLLSETNRLAEAEPLMRRALAITEKKFDPSHPSVANCLGNLAELLMKTNRMDEAEPLIRRALSISEQLYGQDHPTVASCINTLADLLMHTNRLAEAEPLIHRALAIEEQNYGSNHPKIAVSLNQLGELLQYTNRPMEAEPLFRRALKIKEHIFGLDHPSIAANLNNLAAMLWSTNRLSEAEPLLWRSLAIKEKSFGPDHPRVAISLNNLARLLQTTNRLSEAEPIMRRHVAILLHFGQATGYQHPHMGHAIENYYGLLMEMKFSPAEIATHFEELGIKMEH